MLKLLLIDLGDIRGELNEPLGIECISSRVIKEKKIDVDLYWYNMIESETLFGEKILQYDIIGISMNIGTLQRFEHIYELIMHSGNIKFPIILGGCIPTFAYKQLINQYNNIICIYGEGEEPFEKLINCYLDDLYKNSESLMQIGGLAFKYCNKEVITPQTPLDLQEESTPKRDSAILEFMKKHHGIIRLEGSRGCSWNKCSFCCVNAKYANPAWRGFTIEKILNELIEISNAGFHAPYFTDEDFFGQEYDRAIELGEKIIALKKQGKIRNDMNFYISIMAADAVCESGKRALTVLKEAGLREVFLGIESLDKEQLRRYNKKATIDINRKALEYINNLELQIDSGYILFDPEMSFEGLKNSLKYIDDLKINQLDSRSLKKLRIQPLTSVCETLSDVIVGQLDVNNLEYPYQFKDHDVNTVYTVYKKWEDSSICKTWKIQSASRGEVNEDFRVKLKLILGQIRNIDFEVLKKIQESVEESNLDFHNSEFNIIQKHHKDQLIQKAYQLLDKYYI